MEREISQKRSQAIRELLEGGWTVADLARIYGLKPKTIWGIKYRKDPVDKSPLDKSEIKEYSGK